MDMMISYVSEAKSRTKNPGHICFLLMSILGLLTSALHAEALSCMGLDFSRVGIAVTVAIPVAVAVADANLVCTTQSFSKQFPFCGKHCDLLLGGKSKIIDHLDFGGMCCKA